MAISSEPVTYRGIEKEDIIDSLHRGEAFIRELDLGPATEASLESWLESDPYQKISGAADDKELAQVIRETGSSGVFLTLSEIFTAHAAIQTDDAASELAQNLSRWGALSGVRAAVYTPQDEEKDRHLVQLYAGQAKERGTIACARAWFLAAAQSVFDRDTECLRAVHSLIPMVMNGNNDDVRSKAAAKFDNADLHDRYVMLDLLRVMAGQDKAQDKLVLERPLSRYGIVLDGDSENFLDTAGRIRAQTERVFEPFYELDEIDMTGIGVITDDWDQSGVMFQSTRRVAEAVAAAFPDHTIIDHTGRIIGSPEAPSPEGPATPPPQP